MAGGVHAELRAALMTQRLVVLGVPGRHLCGCNPSLRTLGFNFVEDPRDSRGAGCPSEVSKVFVRSVLTLMGVAVYWDDIRLFRILHQLEVEGRPTA
jgi:hypothetical protein